MMLLAALILFWIIGAALYVIPSAFWGFIAWLEKRGGHDF